MKKLVAIPDAWFDVPDIEREVLEPLGARIVTGTWQPRSELAAMASNADVVITRRTPLDSAALHRMQNARAIVRCGGRLSDVDLVAATALGIPVCIVPDYDPDELAEHVVALILAETRQLLSSSATQESSASARSAARQLQQLHGRPVGVIGLGAGGQEVICRLRAFKCSVIAYQEDWLPIGTAPGGAQLTSLDELLRNCDIVVLVAAEYAEQNVRLSAAALRHLRPLSTLVMVTRTLAADPRELVRALDDRRLASLVIDLLDEPNPDVVEPLRRRPDASVFHGAALASQATDHAMRRRAAEIAAAALCGLPLAGIANELKPREYLQRMDAS